MMAEDQPQPLPPVEPKPSRWDAFIDQLLLALSPWLIRLALALIGLAMAWISWKIDQVSRKTDEMQQAQVEVKAAAETAAGKAQDSAVVGLKTLAITAEDAGMPEVAAEAREDLREATTAPTASK